MLKLPLTIVLLFSLLVLLQCSTLAQSNQVKEQQSVYVVAKKTEGNSADLDSEKKAKEEFTKQKKFNVANSATNAEVVFFLLVEYDTYGMTTGTVSQGTGNMSGFNRTYRKTIQAIAVPATIWKEHKDDLEKLKEHSLWIGDATYHLMSEASVSKIVKQFHSGMLKK